MEAVEARQLGMFQVAEVTGGAFQTLLAREVTLDVWLLRMLFLCVYIYLYDSMYMLYIDIDVYLCSGEKLVNTITCMSTYIVVILIFVL